jgi:hypothetical protein
VIDQKMISFNLVTLLRAPHKLKTMRLGTSLDEGRGKIGADADVPHSIKAMIKIIAFNWVTLGRTLDWYYSIWRW